MGVGALAGAGIVESVGNVLDDLFTSDEERAEAKRRLAELEDRPYADQREQNKIEAAHRTVFVAGWRPFIGWTCGVGLAYHFVVFPIFAGFFEWFGWPLRDLEVGELMTLVLSLLGLGGLRTYEKKNGVSR